jgi:hypothetical protein
MERPLVQGALPEVHTQIHLPRKTDSSSTLAYYGTERDTGCAFYNSREIFHTVQCMNCQNLQISYDSVLSLYA